MLLKHRDPKASQKREQPQQITIELHQKNAPRQAHLFALLARMPTSISMGQHSKSAMMMVNRKRTPAVSEPLMADPSLRYPSTKIIQK